MTRRKSAATRSDRGGLDLVAVFLVSTGCRGIQLYLPEDLDVFDTSEEARSMWEELRVETWSRVTPGERPFAAYYFDGILDGSSVDRFSRQFPERAAGCALPMAQFKKAHTERNPKR